MRSLFIIIVFLLFSSSIFAEFILEPVICTTKKTSNCGAYIYNTKTGEVYFCDSKECKEVKTPIEIFIEEEEEEEEEESGSLIPKKPKKKESKIPKKPKKEDSKSNKCKDSKIPKKGCT